MASNEICYAYVYAIFLVRLIRLFFDCFCLAVLEAPCRHESGLGIDMTAIRGRAIERDKLAGAVVFAIKRQIAASDPGRPRAHVVLGGAAFGVATVGRIELHEVEGIMESKPPWGRMSH